MKLRSAHLFGAAALAVATLAMAPDAHAQAHNHDHGAAPAPAAGPSVHGAPVGKAAAVPLRTVLANPRAYTTTPVLVEGVVLRACTTMGCWMQLAPDEGSEGIRVAMKDHAFTIPMNSAGKHARAEGIVEVRQVSKAQADHLEGEGARLQRNADGTATEIRFVATGVELR